MSKHQVSVMTPMAKSIGSMSSKCLTYQNVGFVDKQVFFTKKYMDHNDAKCNSSEYFKDISEVIELSQIYDIKDSFNYNTEMDYCSVYMEIKKEKLRKDYDNCQYLLQVWNKSKTKVYQRPLKTGKKNWAICFRYFVYQFEDEQNRDCIHIVDLEGKKSIVCLENLKIEENVKYLCYNNGYLHWASNDKIYICRIPLSYFDDGDSEVHQRTSLGTHIRSTNFNQEVLTTKNVRKLLKLEDPLPKGIEWLKPLDDELAEVEAINNSPGIETPQVTEEQKIFENRERTSSLQNHMIRVDASKIKIREIVPKKKIKTEDKDQFINLRIHGLLLTKFDRNSGANAVVVIETEDNNLDFNQLYIQNFDGDNKQFYSWTQWRDPPRRTENNLQKMSTPDSNPIVKCCHMYSTANEDQEVATNYSIVMKETGEIDLYCNMYKVESDKEVYAQDIDMTPSSFYVKLDFNKMVKNKLAQSITTNIASKDSKTLLDAKGKKNQLDPQKLDSQLENDENLEIIYHLAHENKTQISIQQAELIESRNFKWEDIKIQRIDNVINLYSSFMLHSIRQETIACIAHGKYLSTYDMIAHKTSNDTSDNIESKWRHYYFPEEVVTVFRHEIDNETIPVVITKDGSIYSRNLLLIVKKNKAKFQKEIQLKIGEEKNNLETQGENQKSLLIKQISINDDKYEMLFDFTDEEQTQELEEEPKIDGEVFEFEDDVRYHEFALVTARKDDHTSAYMIHQGKLYQLDDEILDQGCSTVSLTVVQTDEESKHIIIQCNNNLRFCQILIRNETLQPIVMKEFKNKLEVTGKLHSATSSNIRENLIFFDEKNMYVLDLNTGNIHVHNGIYCVGMRHFSNNINYVLCQANQYSQHPGLRNFNANQVIQKKQPCMQLIKKVDIGIQGFFELHLSSGRMAFMKSLQNLTIIPILHQNKNRFFGMSNPKDYITYKVLTDRVIALSKQGVITTWDLITGKIIHRHDLKTASIQNEKLAVKGNLVNFIIGQSASIQEKIKQRTEAQKQKEKEEQEKALKEAQNKKNKKNKKKSKLDSQLSTKNSQVFQKRELTYIELKRFQLVSVDKEGIVLLKSKKEMEDKVNDKEFFSEQQLDHIENQVNVVMQKYHKYREWMYIEILDEKTVHIHMKFILPNYEVQHLYLNDEKDKLIEVLENYRCNLYIKSQDTKVDMVKWEFKRTITDYPSELHQENPDENEDSNNHNGSQQDKKIKKPYFPQKLHFFSPSFTQYIVLDKKNKRFILKDTLTNQELALFPKELMTFDDQVLPCQAFNRFKWIADFQFLIVNEEGIEKIIKLEKNDSHKKKDEEKERMHFKGDQYNYRPLFNEINGVEWLQYRYYDKRQKLNHNETLKSLQRMYQQYKTSYFLYEKRSGPEFYRDLIGIDPYSMNFNEMSFTYYHWCMIEQIQLNHIKIGDLAEEDLELILFNILPGGNSVLHMLAQNDEILPLLEFSHPDMESPVPKYHVPFLPNFEKKTALHIFEEKDDYKSVDAILKYLKFYPADHHSRGINDLYGEIVQRQCPEFYAYAESRFQQTKQLEQITKGCLKKKYPKIVPFELWFIQKDLTDTIMDEKFTQEEDQLQKIGADKKKKYHMLRSSKKKNEKRIKIEFLDLPSAYHYCDKEFIQLFEALAWSAKPEIFLLKSVQTLVEFNYPLVKEYVIRKLFIPYCFFMFLFFVFMNFIFENPEYQLGRMLYFPFLIVLFLFATYFMVNEAKQFKSEGISYLMSIWNYIDLIPPIGIYISEAIILWNLNPNSILDEEIQRTFFSIITFFMWFKLLYFLRIFNKTGYLIRMIFEVIKDMKYFFLILLITIAAFGDSFLRIALGNTSFNPDEESYVFTTSFINSMIYVYRMVLGDFDISLFGNKSVSYLFILFILCTVFNMIVMLNLLIAIISATFEKVEAIQEQASYQERAKMIAENHYLIPDYRKKKYAKQKQQLLIVTDLEQVIDENNDPVLEGIQKFKETQIKFEQEIEEFQKRFVLQAQNIVHVQKEQENIKHLSYMQMMGNTIMTKIHSLPLRMYHHEYMKSINPDYEEGFFCDGDNVSGCQNGKEQENTDPNEEFYHCDHNDCNYKLCTRCYDLYGNDETLHEQQYSHINKRGSVLGGYKLQKTKHSEYFKDQPESSWVCCGGQIKSQCPNQGKPFSKCVFYHDDIKGFDLCIDCSTRYKIYS